jgi:hypothetical protein
MSFFFKNQEPISGQVRDQFDNLPGYYPLDLQVEMIVILIRLS